MPESAFKELLNHDVSWPLAFGVVTKVKEFTISKGITIMVTIVISCASVAYTFGIMTNKFENVLTRMDKYEKRIESVESIRLDVVDIKADLRNIKETINKYTDRIIP